jgi:hypothetical protein
MNDDFDMNEIADVPDPLSEVGPWPLPPRRAGTLAASPTRSRVVAVRATALAGAIVYELAWIGLMNKRADIGTMPRATLVAEIAIPLAAAALALAAAAARGKRGLGETKGRMTTLALLSPALFGAATLLLSPGDTDGESFWLHTLRCFMWTALYSAGPLLLAAWAFRRSFVAAPAWRSAALGMACGALGAATMSLVCSVGNPAHVLLGHGGMMLVAAAGGALVGRRFGEA